MRKQQWAIALGVVTLSVVTGVLAKDHDDLGSFPLSVGPVHTDGPGQHYEAVFNHRAQAVPTNERTNHE